MTNTALDSVLGQAQQAADSMAQQQALAPVEAQGGAVSAYQAPAKPSLDDMADNAGIQVDAYLSVKEAGLRIDKNEYFQTTDVLIDLSECVPIFSVRANQGGSTTFVKSYDGVSTSQGQSLNAAIAQLRATHTKVDGPYQTVEIPVELTKDVPGAKKGQRLGITPAITGVKFWTKFYKELREKGLQASRVKARLTCVPMTNKNGNDWGVVGFEFLEAA